MNGITPGVGASPLADLIRRLRAERDLARTFAVKLEQENAELRSHTARQPVSLAVHVDQALAAGNGLEWRADELAARRQP